MQFRVTFGHVQTLRNVYLENHHICTVARLIVQDNLHIANYYITSISTLPTLTYHCTIFIVSYIINRGSKYSPLCWLNPNMFDYTHVAHGNHNEYPQGLTS